MILTATQIKLARHALGLPNRNKRSYRNYFCGSKNDPHWNGLVQAGLATSRNHPALLHDDDTYFYLTPAGAQAVLENSEKLCAEDFPSLITRPMLFSAPMIRALHDGRKTQTRRLLNNTKYGVGNRLWVRETWRCNGWATDVATIFYKAHEGDGYTAMTEQYSVADRPYIKPDGKWKPSIHMPRWISRMTLIITNVRQQRLQDISEEDAIAEGVTRIRDGCHVIRGFDYDNAGLCHTHATTPFAKLWDSLNAPHGFDWHSNPLVTALTFKVEKHNIDRMPA